MALETGEKLRKFSVFENVVLRKKLGHKGEDVTVVFRRLRYLYLVLCNIALVVSRILEFCGSNVKNVICI